LGCNGLGTGRVGFDGGDQGDAKARQLQFAIDAEVVFAEGTGTGNCNAQNGLATYSADPNPGVRVTGTG
jgi:hypothetical protein